MLRGALAAAVTPLDGDRLDEAAFGPYVDFLAAGGLDGLLALGTTGEGLLFGVEERKRARRAVPGGRGGPAAGRGPLRRPDDAPTPSRSPRMRRRPASTQSR